MKKEFPFRLTREKHLDHMVKVVPLIVLAYAVQSYLLVQMSRGFGTNSVLFLGACLAVMIGGFVAYDLRHEVTCFEDRLEVYFLGRRNIIFYRDVTAVEVSDPDQSFGHVFIRQGRRKTRLYFVDAPLELKELIEASGSAAESRAA
jgi:hypothetical protein